MSFNTLYKEAIFQDLLPDDFYIKLLSGKFVKYWQTFSTDNYHKIRDEETNFQEKKTMMREGFYTYYASGDRHSAYLNKMYPISHEQIESWFPDYYSRYDSFIVFGCPSSTDIDVACFVPEKYNDNGHPKPLFTSEYQRLESDLTKLGYDLARGVDAVILIHYFDRIIAMSKGGNMIGNVITNTYEHHKQMYTCPNINHVPSDRMDMLKVLSKFILDNLEYLVEDYTQSSLLGKSIHKEKMESYTEGNDSMVLYSFGLLKHFHLTAPSNHAEKWTNVMKSLVMKMIQFRLLKNDEYCFTKKGLCDALDTIYPGRDNIGKNAEWFLFRGKSGEFSDQLIPFLYTEYVSYGKQVIEDWERRMTPIVKQYDRSSLVNPTQITDELFTEFVKSPYKYTDRFQELWDKSTEEQPSGKEHGNDSINSQFIIDCSTPEEQQEFESRLTLTLQAGQPTRQDNSNFIWIPQRVPEWLHLLKFYVCGHSSQVIDNTNMTSKYNLIRGAITELVVMDILNPNDVGLGDFKKYSPGLIVKERGVRSPGCAPDLLLQNPSGEIIPVEIKCLKSNAKNGDYYRSHSLAISQCQRVKEILDKSVIKRCCIIFSWFVEDKLTEERPSGKLELSFFIVDI